MKLEDWPLYVNDEGVVSCGRCGENAADWMPEARRRLVVQFLGTLAAHANNEHGVTLVERKGDDEA